MRNSHKDTVLAVLLEGRKAGELRISRSSWTLSYEPRYLARDDASSLSLSLPLSFLPIQGTHVQDFFTGLLPQGATRRAWADLYGLPKATPAALLPLVSMDALGAVQLVPIERLHDFQLETGDVTPAGPGQLHTLVESLSFDAPSWTGLPGQWTLPGRRAKAAGCWDTGSWHFVTNGAASTHILKAAVTQANATNLGEHVILNAAQALDLPAATSEYVEVSGRSCIVSHRVDRYTQGIDVVRVHYESLAQAFATPTSSALEVEGGPTLADLSRLLRDRVLVGAARTDNERLLDYVLLHILCGCDEESASSFGLLEIREDIRLAPLVSASSAFFDPQKKAAGITSSFALGNTRVVESLTAQDWQDTASSFGISFDLLRARFLHLASTLPDALADEIRDYEGVDGWLALNQDLLELTVQRCRSIAASLMVSGARRRKDGRGRLAGAPKDRAALPSTTTTQPLAASLPQPPQAQPPELADKSPSLSALAALHLAETNAQDTVGFQSSIFTKAEHLGTPRRGSGASKAT
ncbi:MAG: HipA N-terminal domain-containing protein [Actinomycetaceae bacterium]|nr:HipA N-terminal domain-containing protein [Actinomycetaceae bacterium]